MRNFWKCLLVGLLLVCFDAEAGRSCTTFRIDHGESFFFGRNYDWDVEDALLIVNKRGVSKRAFLFENEKGRPAAWKSKFGSVTFNQYGRGLPCGGMNEAGLVIEVMTLRETVHPEADSRPVVRSSQWVQYQLDRFSTVEEVIASDSRVRIISTPNAPGLHYLASDKSGACASIEFLGGRMVVHTGEDMPVMALANTPYADSVEHWDGGAARAGDGSGSVSRFIRAANMAKAYEPEDSRPPEAYAFKILSSVVIEGYTKWSIVYDQTNARVHFITASNRNVRTVDVGRFDFSCKTPVRILDATADLSGDVTDKFREYTPKANRDLIGASFGKTWFLRHYPKETLDAYSLHPESMRCEP